MTQKNPFAAPLHRLAALRGRVSPLLVRRVLAVALVLLAAALALGRPTARGEPTATVLVAAHELTAGTVLRPTDLRAVQAPAALVPAGALTDIAAATGHTLAGPAGTGEPITGVRLVGAANTRLSADFPGAAAVPVRLADPAVAELLGPGSRVDVVTVDPHGGAASVLAADATVVTVRDDGSRDRGGKLVVLALPHETAAQVASISLGQPVTVTLR